MIEFVQHLKQLNETIDIKLPEISIENILKDPRQFAYDFIEIEFAKAIPKFIESFESGKEFGNATRGLILEGEKRMYLDGKDVDSNLPPAYQYGGTLNNPEEYCENCKFYVHTKNGDYCSVWDTNVRDEYWCKKWQKVSK